MGGVNAPTALVTGSGGFIGRHMVAELVQQGWDVLGVDAACDPPCPPRTVLVNAHDVFNGVVLAGRHFDLVVHAAARAPHRLGIDRDLIAFSSNVELDAAMFRWAVQTGQGHVIYLSSSAVYPAGLQQSDRPYLLNEDDAISSLPVTAELLAALGDAGRLDPADTYGWTKAIGERMAMDARRSGLPVTIVRPFSGYGEDQSENFPFRAFVERARRQEDPFVIWGDGSQVRDFIHVDDIVRLTLRAAQVIPNSVVNLCTGEPTSLADLARMMCYRAGYAPTFEYRHDMPAGVGHRVGATWRLRDRVGMPRISLAEGVRRALPGSVAELGAMS